MAGHGCTRQDMADEKIILFPRDFSFVEFVERGLLRAKDLRKGMEVQMGMEMGWKSLVSMYVVSHVSTPGD